MPKLQVFRASRDQLTIHCAERAANGTDEECLLIRKAPEGIVGQLEFADGVVSKIVRIWQDRDGPLMNLFRLLANMNQENRTIAIVTAGTTRNPDDVTDSIHFNFGQKSVEIRIVNGQMNGVPLKDAWSVTETLKNDSLSRSLEGLLRTRQSETKTRSR